MCVGEKGWWWLQNVKCCLIGSSHPSHGGRSKPNEDTVLGNAWCHNCVQVLKHCFTGPASVSAPFPQHITTSHYPPPQLHFSETPHHRPLTVWWFSSTDTTDWSVNFTAPPSKFPHRTAHYTMFSFLFQHHQHFTTESSHLPHLCQHGLGCLHRASHPADGVCVQIY